MTGRGDIIAIGRTPIRWNDGLNTHAVSGTDLHPGVRLLWTDCARDVPGGKAYTSPEPPTCPYCRVLPAARPNPGGL